MSFKLGETLVSEGLINPEQLKEVLDEQARTGRKLGHLLVKRGLVEDSVLAAILSKQYGVAFLDLAKVEIDPAILKKVPAEVAQKYQVIPVERSGQKLTVAMTDPTNIFAMDTIRFRTGYHVKPVVATDTAIEDAIGRYYGSATSLAPKELDGALMELDDPDVEVLEETEEIDLEELERGSEDAPVVQLVNHILTDAVRRGASDIHIEPFERELRVRCRIDGILYLVMNPPLKLKENITTRIKILAKLDIAERRIPQGGRFKIRTKGNGKLRELEFRVSVLPTLFGEKVVLRLLDKDQLQLDMTKLGFERPSLARFEKAILKPWGMVLVTGPTGSGKTNTLYSAIGRLNTMETNIMTADDPVEFNLLGVNQVQVREQVGLNFANALREFLRQDPNIILVGEVRDFDVHQDEPGLALAGLEPAHDVDLPAWRLGKLNEELFVEESERPEVEPFGDGGEEELQELSEELLQKRLEELVVSHRAPLTKGDEFGNVEPPSTPEKRLARRASASRASIRPEVAFEVALGHARVHGRIDLMLQANGGDRRVELIDFKTSENRPPSEIHINQLRLYAVASERLGLEPVKLAIHDLEADEGRRHVFGNNDRDAFATRLEGWVNGIRTGGFQAVENRSICPDCDFRRFCRYAPTEAKRTR